MEKVTGGFSTTGKLETANDDRPKLTFESKIEDDEREWLIQNKYSITGTKREIIDESGGKIITSNPIVFS